MLSMDTFELLFLEFKNIAGELVVDEMGDNNSGDGGDNGSFC